MTAAEPAPQHDQHDPPAAAGPAPTAAPETVLVIGTGMVGTSVGLALRAAGVPVVLADTDAEALAEAVALGAGRAALPADRPGTVVVGVPPDDVAAVVTAALAAYPGAVVTDVSSVKSGPLGRLLASPAAVDRYVGGHPMAGSERSGPAAARVDLFTGRPWAVTPHPHSRPSAVAAVHRLARLCGAVPVTLDAAEHDRAVARVSHLPHAAAAAVGAVLAETPDSYLALTGQGLRDVTRVAAGDPGLWSQILRANAGPVAESLAALRRRIDVLIGALAAAVPAGGADPLAAALAVGVDGVSRLPGRHGPVEELARVTVVVADSPGQLARLFVAVEAAGVNVADVRLDHRSGQEAGVVELSVAPAAVSGAVAALTAAGWTARPGQ